MANIIKGFKVFEPNWTCRGFQYEVGKEYFHDGNIGLCEAGFHFCQVASDCFNYYSFNPDNKVAEVEAIGLTETDGNKSVTNNIRIVHEIPWQELLTIVNTGKACTGLCNTGNGNTGNGNTGNGNTGNGNTGDWNTGNRNTGDWNTGNGNTGDCNTGICNTGNGNTGNRNTGNGNTGDGNTGNRNTGDWNTGSGNTGSGNTGNRNTGNRNTGDGNTGDGNTGNWNTGNWNTGNWNTGNWNTGNGNTGFFNTDEPFVRSFNKPTKMRMDEFRNLDGIKVLTWNYENSWWIYSDNMTDAEKAAHPEHETTGGYLKTVTFHEACRMMWDRLDESERKAVRAIPNFNAKMFKEITGIDSGERK